MESRGGHARFAAAGTLAADPKPSFNFPVSSLSTVRLNGALVLSLTALG